MGDLNWNYYISRCISVCFTINAVHPISQIFMVKKSRAFLLFVQSAIVSKPFLKILKTSRWHHPLLAFYVSAKEISENSIIFKIISITWSRISTKKLKRVFFLYREGSPIYSRRHLVDYGLFWWNSLFTSFLGSVIQFICYLRAFKSLEFIIQVVFFYKKITSNLSSGDDFTKMGDHTLLCNKCRT